MILPAHTVLTRDEARDWLYSGGQFVHLSMDEITHFLEENMWSYLHKKGQRYGDFDSYGWIMLHAIRTGKAHMLYGAKYVCWEMASSMGHVCSLCGNVDRTSWYGSGDMLQFSPRACGWVDQEDNDNCSHVFCSKCNDAWYRAGRNGHEDADHRLAVIFASEAFRRRVKNNADNWASFRFDPRKEMT